MTAAEPAAPLRLDTARLELVALTADLVDALGDSRSAERSLGAVVPDNWPDSELAGLLALYGPRVAEDPGRIGYGPWVLIARDEGTVVGSAGFLGAPADSPEIELGYGVHPDYRNRGYATEATQALVAWALQQVSVRRVLAKCDPANTPSVRVLEKIGMTQCGIAETGMLLWEAIGERGG